MRSQQKVSIYVKNNYLKEQFDNQDKFAEKENEIFTLSYSGY